MKPITQQPEWIDLTPEVRRELNRKRRGPVWRGMLIGFALGVAFAVIVVAIVSWFVNLRAFVNGF